jgi:2-iminoacetate synthase ThiH
VISKAGAHHTATEGLLRATIREAGFVPVKRNAAYRRLHERAPGDRQHARRHA